MFEPIEVALICEGILLNVVNIVAKVFFVFFFKLPLFCYFDKTLIVLSCYNNTGLKLV